MNSDTKLAKLYHLRKLREQLSLGALMQAKSDVHARKADVIDAERTFLKVRNKAYRDTKRALLDAARIRDSAARFAGIALTMQRGNDNVEFALHHIEDCEDMVTTAQEVVLETQDHYHDRSRERMRFDKIDERLTANANLQAARIEEDEIAELFRLMQKET